MSLPLGHCGPQQILPVLRILHSVFAWARNQSRNQSRLPLPEQQERQERLGAALHLPHPSSLVLKSQHVSFRPHPCLSFSPSSRSPVSRSCRHPTKQRVNTCTRPRNSSHTEGFFVFSLRLLNSAIESRAACSNPSISEFFPPKTTQPTTKADTVSGHELVNLGEEHVPSHIFALVDPTLGLGRGKVFPASTFSLAEYSMAQSAHSQCVGKCINGLILRLFQLGVRSLEFTDELVRPG